MGANKAFSRNRIIRLNPKFTLPNTTHRTLYLYNYIFQFGWFYSVETEGSVAPWYDDMFGEEGTLPFLDWFIVHTKAECWHMMTWHHSSLCLSKKTKKIVPHKLPNLANAWQKIRGKIWITDFWGEKARKKRNVAWASFRWDNESSNICFGHQLLSLLSCVWHLNYLYTCIWESNIARATSQSHVITFNRSKNIIFSLHSK